MAAPDQVRVPSGRAKYYESPPRREGSWRAERPGDLHGVMPELAGTGRQGPDQGYALKLVRSFEGRAQLMSGERWPDVAAGAVVVALKRASIFGRAPVKYDIEVALTVWGFLDDSPDAELVELRRRAFDHVESSHHYLEARRIADAVPEGSLRLTPAQVAARYSSGWQSVLDVGGLANSAGQNGDGSDEA